MSNEKINAIIRVLRRSAETLTPGKRRDVNNKLDRITMALRNAEVRDDETDPAIEFERQRQIVYNYLLAGNTITSLEAIRKWGITRLSARIMDIEKMTGKAPSRRRINVKNRNGRTVSVCEYWIDKED